MSEGAIEKSELPDNCRKYLDKINIAGPLQQQVQYFFNEYKTILKAVTNNVTEEVNKIFVTETENKEARRMLENLWFFSPNYVMEIKDFQNKGIENIDINELTGEVVYLQVKKNYSFFEDITESSNLYVYFRLSSYMDGELRASGENCRYLSEIMRDCFAKNLSKVKNPA